MTTSVIIHPCFQKCQDYTLDQYWKNIFFSCACNKFPKGVRYDGSTRTLYIRVSSGIGKSTVEVVDLPEKPEEAYKVLLHIFREKLGLYSSKDLQIKKQDLEEIKNQRRINMNCEWKKLKPRSIREQLILNYVTKIKKEYNLTPKEAKNLLITIQLGFQFKKLNSDDVEYSDREIKSIQGLEYNSAKKSWMLTNSSRPVSKSEKLMNTQKFTQAIDKFAREVKSRKLQF